MLRSLVVLRPNHGFRNSSGRFHALRMALFSPQQQQGPARITTNYLRHIPIAGDRCWFSNQADAFFHTNRRRRHDDNNNAIVTNTRNQPRHSHSGQQRRQSKDSWIRQIHSQMDYLCHKVPLGKFTSRHRQQVEHLLTNILHQYQRHTTPQTHPQQKSRLFFQLMDRLCHEAEFIQQQHPNQPYIRPSYDPDSGELLNSPTSFLAIHGLKLGTLLSSVWKDEYLTAIRKQSEDLSFTPVQVSERIVRYIHAGLLQNATPFPFSLVLHAIRATADPTQAHLLAQPIFYQTCMHDLGQRYHRDFQPNVFVTNEMMHIWANSAVDGAATQAEELLTYITQRYRAQPQDPINLQPNAMIYTTLMKVHANEAKGKMGGSETSIHKAFTRIQELFVEMKNVCEDITTISYNRTIHALMHCRHPQSPDAAQAVVDELLELYEQGRQERLARSEKERRHGDSSSSDDARVDHPQKQQLLPQQHDSTEAIHLDDDDRFKPSQHTFATLITAYGRASRFAEARAVFQRMKQLYRVTKDATYRPDEQTYSAYLWAGAKVGDFQHAEEVIAEMMNEIEQQKDDYLKLGTLAWQGMLASLAESGDEKASENIALILERLQKSAAQRNISFETDTVSYNIFMSSHARENSLKGAEAAEKLFRWMDQPDQPEGVKPNRDTCLDLISAWANAGDIDRAEETLFEFLDRINKGEMEPNLIDHLHVNLILNAWSNANVVGQAGRAQAIFDQFQEMNMQPEVISYTSLMWAYIREPTLPHTNLRDHKQHVADRVYDLFQQMERQYQSGDDRAKATPMTYNAVLTALNKSFTPEAGEQAQEILDIMLSRQVKFDERLFNMVMSSWGRRGEAEKAEDIYQHFMGEGFQPSVHLFVTRLAAWSRVGNAEKTSSILQEWIELYNSGEVDRRPETKEFNIVVGSWCQRGEPERAEAGLKQMIEFANSGRFDCFPNAATFSTVISGYARNMPNSPIERVIGLFELQKSLSREHPEKYGPPDLLMYWGLIHCLCFEDPLSPQTENQIFQLIRELKSQNDPVFWTKYRSVDILKKIRKSLVHCGLGDRDFHRVDHDFEVLMTLARKNIKRSRGLEASNNTM